MVEEDTSRVPRKQRLLAFGVLLISTSALALREIFGANGSFVWALVFGLAAAWSLVGSVRILQRSSEGSRD